SKPRTWRSAGEVGKWFCDRFEEVLATELQAILQRAFSVIDQNRDRGPGLHTSRSLAPGRLSKPRPWTWCDERRRPLQVAARSLPLALPLPGGFYESKAQLSDRTTARRLFLLVHPGTFHLLLLEGVQGREEEFRQALTGFGLADFLPRTAPSPWRVSTSRPLSICRAFQ